MMKNIRHSKVTTITSATTVARDNITTILSRFGAKATAQKSHQ